MSNVSTSKAFLRRVTLSPEQAFVSDSVESAEERRSARYRIKVPDSRLKVKQSILFVPLAGTGPITDLTAASAKLWAAGKDHDSSGILGYDPVVTNILGTQAAPSSIIASAGLQGYSLETDGSAIDYLQGVFSALCNGPTAPKGTWYVAATYQPGTGQNYSDAEWAALRSMFGLTVAPL